MSSEDTLQEDPLVAALPPATDYITYLTLLEYQLNTRNLSTLNRLLSEDDGALAQEIGWDLLKMVLPMLQVIPEEANKCFAIIARRGNPREVVVRVAEELEILGRDDEDDLSQTLEDDQDELPTFPGEATRIHLGKMKLDGLPEQETTTHPTEPEVQEEPEPEAEDAESGSDDALSLQALVSMLGILHPRIKTQHPSRFLATSLPAALGAYRRLPITEATTSSFIALLGRLSGKQRPALPPRTSTAGSTASFLVSNVTSSAVPLKDPEADTEESIATQATMANEKAIIQRLLQAVLLEVVDDYTGSFIAHEELSMHFQWSTRIREKLRPERTVPGRASVTQQWSEKPDLVEMDGLMTRLLNLTKDLSLDVKKEVEQHIVLQAASHSMEDEEEEEENPVDDTNVTDYPQTPAEIPLSVSALIILQAARQFYITNSDQAISLTTALSCLAKLDSISPSYDSPLIDATLSLLYASLLDTSVQNPISAITRPQVEDALNNLMSIFTSCPNDAIRDNAHNIASIIFHQRSDQATKLAFIKARLQDEPPRDSSIRHIQSGNLKSIAVKWLKDEFLASTRPSDPSPIYPPLSPHILSTDVELPALLFPSLPPMPGPFISSHDTGMSNETDLHHFLLNMPYHIASLNMITILVSISPHDEHTEEPSTAPSAVSPSVASSHPPGPDTNSLPTSANTNTNTNVNANANAQAQTHAESALTLTPELFERARDMVSTLGGWRTGLMGLQDGRTQDPARNQIFALADLFALEDAVGRADSAVRSVNVDE